MVARIVTVIKNYFTQLDREFLKLIRLNQDYENSICSTNKGH